MLASMSGQHLAEWMAYAELEPFGEERADLRAGIVAAVIANVNRDPKKGQPYRPEDFMPSFGQRTTGDRPQEDVAEKVKRYFGALVRPPSPTLPPNADEHRI